MPLLGETPEVKGLWSAAAVWVKEGPAVGKSIAEWMIHGEPEIDCNQSDISRFHAHQKTRQHTKARAFEAFPKTYGIVHPAEQYLSDRPLRRSPMHEWHVEHEGEFFEVAGWERPQWFRSNAPLVERYGVGTRPNEWDARWWSPIINAEHLAMRESAGIFDLSAFAIFDVVGPGALDAVQAVALRQMDVPVGRVVYTPVLSEHRRLQERPHDHAARGPRLPRRHRRRPRHERPQVVPRPPAGRRRDRGPDHGLHDDRRLGPAGPRHRPSVTRADMSNEAFRFGTCRTVEIGSQLVLASRISYVGDLGWELYVPMEQGRRLWEDALGRRAGRTA